jgi:hypothetical protein
MGSEWCLAYLGRVTLSTLRHSLFAWMQLEHIGCLRSHFILDHAGGRTVVIDT